MKTFLLLASFFSLAQAVGPAAQLREDTLTAFDDYIRKAEMRVDARARGSNFLWADESPARLKQVREGGIAIRPVVGKGDLEIPHGLVHDWVGAVFVPGADIQAVLAAVQDYDNKKYTHKPEVLDSKLLRRDGNDFKIYLRVWKKKIVSAVLDTEHDVRYYKLDDTRWHSRSYSTRISEVENAGKPDEKKLPPGDDHGFMWRLNSYWRFAQRDGGVYVECEAISLSRNVPTGLGWLIQPIIRDLPRESLENTLQSTRNAVKTGAPAAQLRKDTLTAFEDYIRKAEMRVDARARGSKFLWADESPATLKQVREGGIAIRPVVGKGDLEIPHGLVHDWVGAVFVPGAGIQAVLAAVQDYDSDKYTHKPEVLDSKLLRRDGNDFKIYLRVWKKKIVSAVLDTEHDVHYYKLDETRWHSRSYSTRISEVENAGKPDEKKLPPGDDHGFMWRLNSYWRFAQRDGGVYVECEAISLSRNVPTGLGWLIEPIIRDLPRESLENTLRSTRNAVKTGDRRK